MRTSAGQFVDCKAVRLVVQPESDDFVAKAFAVLLGSVNDGEQLFVLDVLARHRRRVQRAPVKNALVQIPPAQIASCIAFDRDDRQLLVFKEDSRAGER